MGSFRTLHASPCTDCTISLHRFVQLVVELEEMAHCLEEAVTRMWAPGNRQHQGGGMDKIFRGGCHGSTVVVRPRLRHLRAGEGEEGGGAGGADD